MIGARVSEEMSSQSKSFPWKLRGWSMDPTHGTTTGAAGAVLLAGRPGNHVKRPCLPVAPQGCPGINRSAISLPECEKGAGGLVTETMSERRSQWKGPRSSAVCPQ